jgi:F-type H+-transporting ATPase subunit epsilon
VAGETFICEVLTPEGEAFKDEVQMVSTRTTLGSIGIRARHQPLLGALEPSELRLYRSDSEVVRLAQGEGYVQVTPDGVLLLVQEATPPDELDVSRLREQLSEAEEGMRSADEDSEEHARHERDKKRWEAFLEVAEGGGSSR